MKLPYGISNFGSLLSQGYHYVDRTTYIPQLEALGEKYLIFLRPRRFGKSLWLSALAHYYGQEHAGAHEPLFAGLHVGDYPTPLAHQYLVLEFDFSGIDTRSRELTYTGFFDSVEKSIRRFLQTYREILAPYIDPEQVIAKAQAQPEGLITELFLSGYHFPLPVYLLIDEYDHFTNSLLSQDLGFFQDITGPEGWLRTFYERLKIATKTVIDRIFITGVSPVTLDSLTSGFNIGSNLTLDPQFHDLMGFQTAEVAYILQIAGVSAESLPAVMTDMRRWYDGYCFAPEGEHAHLFNPDMVLYFAKEYRSRQAYPREWLDTNIASDYGRIRQVFRLGGRESESLALLRRLLEAGQMPTYLTPEFSFVKGLSEADFLSLLFYMGLLTIQGTDLDQVLLGPPNAVIERLYFDYFRAVIQEREGLPEQVAVQETVLSLARHNDPRPLLTLVSETLAKLSARDWQHFSENSLKAILVSYLYSSQLYHIRSEPETDAGYVDLLLRRRPPFGAPYQFAFELKTLKKKQAVQLEATIATGRTQLQGYLASDDLRTVEDLHAWLVVFVGTELAHVEEVTG